MAPDLGLLPAEPASLLLQMENLYFCVLRFFQQVCQEGTVTSSGLLQEGLDRSRHVFDLPFSPRLTCLLACGLAGCRSLR